MDILVGLLAFVLLPAGAISLLILVSMAIARIVQGPTPADPSSPPTLRHAYTITILVTVTILGVLSFAALYVLGSALARL